MRIFHIVDPAVWALALESGEYVPDSFDADGFVHFSFREQVARTANAIYRNRDELVVIEFESGDVPAELRVEDSYGTGEAFPHVYGQVPPEAALAVHALTRDAAGDWVFPAGDDDVSDDAAGPA